MRVLMLALLLGGCGYKKEIESLTAEVASRDEAIRSRDQTIQELEGQIRDLQLQIDGLKQTIGERERELAGLQADLANEREKAARMLADKGALKSEIDSMKAAMAELAERKRQAEERVAQFRELLARFKALIDAGTLQVRIVDGRMVLVLATDILFASGSADLSQGGKDALTQVAAILAEMTDKRFQVEGHTDNVPIATSRFPNNWYLAAARAIGVVEHLDAAGMAPTQLSAASFADTRPVASNDTKESRSANRRIEIVIVPDLSQLPGYEELQQAAQ